MPRVQYLSIRQGLIQNLEAAALGCWCLEWSTSSAWEQHVSFLCSFVKGPHLMLAAGELAVDLQQSRLGDTDTANSNLQPFSRQAGFTRKRSCPAQSIPQHLAGKWQQAAISSWAQSSRCWNLRTREGQPGNACLGGARQERLPLKPDRQENGWRAACDLSKPTLQDPNESFPKLHLCKIHRDT